MVRGHGIIEQEQGVVGKQRRVQRVQGAVGQELGVVGLKQWAVEYTVNLTVQSGQSPHVPADP